MPLSIMIVPFVGSISLEVVQYIAVEKLEGLLSRDASSDSFRLQLTV
jgi:ABC-type phosphate transport system permease subunit